MPTVGPSTRKSLFSLEFLVLVQSLNVGHTITCKLGERHGYENGTEDRRVEVAGI